MAHSTNHNVVVNKIIELKHFSRNETQKFIFNKKKHFSRNETQTFIFNKKKLNNWVYLL